MIYECLVEPTVNFVLFYEVWVVPDECYSTKSIEGWFLSALIFAFLAWLLKILFNLLVKRSFLELLIVVEKKYNLYIPTKDSDIENMKLIEFFKVFIIAMMLFFFAFSLIHALVMFASYLASMALNVTGWTLS
mgnify:CR=1 FL=1